MISVIMLVAPLTLPKLLGISIYGVLTGSMTPAYSVGGVVYVAETEPDEIQVGDVITYGLGSDTEYVMTHRVIQSEDGYFITKGDANNVADPEPVTYERLIGKVVFFLPGMAGVAEFVNSVTGKCIFIMLFAAAFICWVTADMLCPSQKKKSENKRTQKADKKANAKNRRGFIMQLLGVLLIVGAAAYLVVVFLGYKESENEYASLEQEVFGTVETSFEVQTEADNTKAIISEDEISAEDQKVLDGIAALHEKNPEVIGWIQFENMDISYPIMQGKDNDYYLSHTFSGEENSAGSIFMEASNSPDFEDCHTIVYGHNMKNRSMFGSLKNYKKKDYYEGNEYFRIFTLDKVYRYQIFAYYDISMYGDVYNNQFGPDDYFQSFIDTMVSRSYYDTGVIPEKTDKIVTLSTCSTEGNRFVINALRVQ